MAATHESKTKVDLPHRQFHIDIIRRYGQYVMIAVDHFSNFIHAKLVQSEKATDLRDGIIALTTPIRQPGPISITTDSAVGFQSLEKAGDTQLSQLQIELTTADEFNRNYNAVVDHACRELEAELHKLAPEGEKISQA